LGIPSVFDVSILLSFVFLHVVWYISIGCMRVRVCLFTHRYVFSVCVYVYVRVCLSVY
jgi:hypothetical protein